jgi:hypothetical protein
MKSFDTVQEAFRLHDEGYNISQISRALGVSRMAIRSWFVQPLDVFAERQPGGSRQGSYRHRETHDNTGCSLVKATPLPEYAYLLGQYLGDGYINEVGPRGVFRLRITTCDDYPDIRQRCVDAIDAVLPNHRVGFVQSEGCGDVSAYSKHWPCLFPQHGPGKKHQRVIRLEPWQETIVEAEPRQFVTGLIHSDGWRGTNNVVVRGKLYSYPRYMFKNESTDILQLCGWGFDLVGVEWKYNNRNSLSVAKRDSVAILDTFIGPKS